MLDSTLKFFNSRHSSEQVAILIGGGIAMLWAGIQLGEIIAYLSSF
ncbi:hypothetical protein [Lolliginicoccus suaedae]|nr:hypothetical protein [Lolliginicoccus suaedae]